MYGRALAPGLGGTGLAILLFAFKDVRLSCWMAWVLGVVAVAFLLASVFFGLATLPMVYNRWPRIGHVAGVENTRATVEALGALHAEGNALRRSRIPDSETAALQAFDAEIAA